MIETAEQTQQTPIVEWAEMESQTPIIETKNERIQTPYPEMAEIEVQTDDVVSQKLSYFPKCYPRTLSQ